MKALKFIGSSLDDLRNFPDEARRATGFELRALQNGLEPSDWKPMQSVAPGVTEIRILARDTNRLEAIYEYRC
jgi:phage-related protein